MRHIVCILAVGLAGLAGCSSASHDGQESPKFRVGVGFGESLDTRGGGHHRVLDLSEEATSTQRADGERLVSVLIEECAPPGRNQHASAHGWLLMLDSGASVRPRGEIAPTSKGSPSLPASLRLQPGECGVGEIRFLVPVDADIAAVSYHVPGARRQVWRH